MARDIILFLKEFLRLRQQIGSIFPSSRKLGREIARQIHQREEPIRVLEVGPGTGVISREVFRRLTPKDDLVMVEMNPQFCEILESKIRLWREEQAAPQGRVWRGRLEDYSDEKKFDFILSSLPFGNFTQDMAASVFQKFRSLLEPGGVVSYYEYIGMRTLVRVFARKKEKMRVQELDAFFRKEVWPYVYETDLVLGNLPPARVLHVRFNQSVTPGSLNP